MRRYLEVLSMLIVGILALILAFIFHLPLLAQIIITIAGSLMSLSMLIEMIRTLRSGRYGVDLLALLAVVSTLAISQYWAALMILIMLTGGNALEDYAQRKANSNLKSLLNNTPQIAHQLKNGKISDLPVNKISVGDKLVIKPKEVVPIDGHIFKGETFVDQSSLTGESKPVKKSPSQNIMSGSVNGDDGIVIKADKKAKESQYQQLVKLVKESQAKPARFVRLADRYAIPFTAISLFIAGVAWIIAQNPVRFAEVLVVASPCPLILAAPVALVSGMSKSSQAGIILKMGNILEKLSLAKTAAFDKTGTLTSGKLSLDKIKAYPPFNQTQIVKLAASVEQNSSHILAHSLLSYAKVKKLTLCNPDKIQEVSGNGIKGQIKNKIIKVGQLKFVAPSMQKKVLFQTAIYISIGGKYAGYMSFADQVRPETIYTIKQLPKLHINNILMLTGDQQPIASHIASQLHIHKIKANLLPAEKIEVLKNISKTKRPVIMVGDGVNDAPSLASADVGIAMGARGSTAASESAGAVISKDNLSKIIVAIKIAKYTMKIAKQSVWFGLSACTILMVIASFGVIPSLFGAILQEIVDTFSILWALRALR